MILTMVGMAFGAREGDPSADNLYDVLGVSEYATPDDIKRAYFSLVRKYRPGDNPEAFQKFNDARWVLEDPPKRNKYDQMRRYGRRLKSLLDEADVATRHDAHKAVPLLRSAVALAPALPLPRALLADVHLMIGEWASAERQLQWLVKDSERDEQQRYRLALCQFHQNKWTSAEENLGAALAINPMYHDALMLLAQVYDAMKRTSRAIATLERAIENDGMENYNDVDALLHLLALHTLSKNDRGLEKTAQRILTALTQAGEAEILRGAHRIYERANEYFANDNRLVTVEFLRQARRLNFGDAALLQAINDLSKRARLADEARLACADRALPATLRSFVQVVYLDQTADPRRETRIEALRGTLAAEQAAHPEMMTAACERLRGLFAGIANEEAQFFDDLLAGRVVARAPNVAPEPHATSRPLPSAAYASRTDAASGERTPTMPTLGGASRAPAKIGNAAPSVGVASSLPSPAANRSNVAATKSGDASTRRGAPDAAASGDRTNISTTGTTAAAVVANENGTGVVKGSRVARGRSDAPMVMPTGGGGWAAAVRTSAATGSEEERPSIWGRLMRFFQRS